MTKILRKLQKLFGTGGDVGQYGSGQLGTKVTDTDLDVLQALTAWINGWADAVISGEKLPPLEEMNCLAYVFSQQLGYLFQEGIPEYLSTKEYHVNSVVKKAGTNELYSSKITPNLGQTLVDGANWQLLGDLGSLIQATETIRGTAEFLTNAELKAGTDTTRFANASAILSLFSASTLNPTNSIIKIPINIGGAFVEFIIQTDRSDWGSVSSGTETFALTFPTAVLAIVALDVGGPGTLVTVDDVPYATTGFDWTSVSNIVQAMYIAVGY